MENNTHNDKKTTRKNDGVKPVHLVRRGAIAASIWHRQTQTGHAYYEYTLSRSWKSKNGEREGYSQSFSTKNGTDLLTVIEGATRWIIQQEQAVLDSVPVAETPATV